MIEQSNETWLLGFKKFLERKYPGRTTATHYLSDLKQFLTHYDGSLLKVTQQDIDQFIDSQRKAGK